MPENNPLGYLPEQTPEQIVPTRDMAMALLQERGAPLTPFNLNGAMQILATNPQILDRISMAQATTNRRAPVDSAPLAPPAAGAGDGRFDLAERAAMGKPQAGVNISEVSPSDAQGETEGAPVQQAEQGGLNMPLSMAAVPAALAYALAKRRGMNVPRPSIGADVRASVPRTRAPGNVSTAGASPVPPATGATTRAAEGEASASSFTGGLDGEMPSPPKSRTSVRVNGKTDAGRETDINAASKPSMIPDDVVGEAPLPRRKPSAVGRNNASAPGQGVPLDNPSVQAAEQQAVDTGVVKAGTRIEVPGVGTVTISRDMPKADFDRLRQAYADDADYFNMHGRRYTQPLSEDENPNSQKNVKKRIEANKGG